MDIKVDPQQLLNQAQVSADLAKTRRPQNQDEQELRSMAEQFEAEESRSFLRAIIRDLSALEHMLDRDMFETDDEIYLCRIHGELHHLLHSQFTGKATGFVHEDWDEDDDPEEDDWDEDDQESAA